jgi:hypothetical protein
MELVNLAAQASQPHAELSLPYSMGRRIGRICGDCVGGGKPKSKESCCRKKVAALRLFAIGSSAKRSVTFSAARWPCASCRDNQVFIDTVGENSHGIR